MKNILVLHGPNLNLLGSREPDVYGRITLDEINEQFDVISRQKRRKPVLFPEQRRSPRWSNACSRRGPTAQQFIIINPAAFTHTSVALRDALAAVAIPFIEVHLSNVFAREAFRKESFFSDLAIGVISGLGAAGYEFAVQFALNYKNQA